MWELLGDGLTLRDALLELLQFGDNLIPPRNLCVKKQLQGGNGAKCFLWPKVNSAVSVGMCKLSPINFIALGGGGVQPSALPVSGFEAGCGLPFKRELTGMHLDKTQSSKKNNFREGIGDNWGEGNKDAAHAAGHLVLQLGVLLLGTCGGPRLSLLL